MRNYISFALLFLITNIMAADVTSQMVHIPGGIFKPFFKQESQKEIKVDDFFLDIYPVSVEDFNQFLKKNPEYRKSKIVKLYSDSRYLEDWPKDVLSKKELEKKKQSPVVNVSWFVARKYCQSLGKRLPTIAEWEYVADGSNPLVIEQILKWYAKKTTIEAYSIGKKEKNKYGLHDMHGLIWEWVEDFNTVMLSPDSRAKGEKVDGFFCGGGSLNAEDAKEYATFMRYAMRGSLLGNYSMHSLGFRCAYTKK